MISEADADEERRALVAEAYEAQKMAYVPYSGFTVGAALLTGGGRGRRVLFSLWSVPSGDGGIL